MLLIGPANFLQPHHNMTPLAQKIAEVIDSCFSNPEGSVVWRGMILNEEWKILATYNGRDRESLQVIVKRRDQI